MRKDEPIKVEIAIKIINLCNELIKIGAVKVGDEAIVAYEKSRAKHKNKTTILK